MNSKVAIVMLLSLLSSQVVAGQSQNDPGVSYRAADGSLYKSITLLTSCSSIAPAGYVVTSVVQDPSCYSVGAPQPYVGFVFTNISFRPVGSVVNMCTQAAPQGWSYINIQTDSPMGVCTAGGALTNVNIYQIKRVY